MSRLAFATFTAMVCLPFSVASEPLDATFKADIASMESCVLETAHVGEEDSCTGLIANGCIEDGHALRACLDHETSVWAAIARDMQQTLGDKTEVKTGCGADDGSPQFALCQVQALARLASKLLLAVEG